MKVLCGCYIIPQISVLKFTPLEFETPRSRSIGAVFAKLKFTPLEFETPT